MLCPHCSKNLNVSHRQGVEIDTCPQCRGVWLDRGELDKIIDRYNAYDDEDDHVDRENFRRQHHPRRKSFWQELFD
jgi:Zn-finger nucleic acid-binding protein